MSTPLSLYARLWDLGTGAVAKVTVQRTNLTTHVVSTATDQQAVATGDMITQWAIGRKKSQAGTVKLGIAFGNAFACAVIQGLGGPTYKGTIHKYLVQLSRDGGATFCTACWLEGCTIALDSQGRGILIEAEDTFSGFSRTYIDHMTFDGAPLHSVLDGAAGTIPITTDTGDPSGGTTGSGGVYPAAFAGLRGLDKSIPIAPSDRLTNGAVNPPLFTYTFTPSSAPTGYADTPINADIWDDSVANALLTVLRAAAGKFDGTDSAPVGARAAYHVDAAHQLVACGYVGSTVKMALASALADGLYEPGPSTALFDLSKLAITPGTEAMRAQAQFTGGASNHGLPDGATITGLETIFHDATANAGHLHLLVVAIKTGNDGGGVYFFIHDGVLRPLSQVFDVNCMAWDLTGTTLVIGTDHGVFTWVQDIGGLTTVPTWTRAGSLVAKVLSICVPAANTIWALVDEGSGKTNIFQFPAIGTEDNSDLGFGGWSRLKDSGTITAMSGGFGNLYYVESADPTTLLYQAPGVPVVPIAIPGGAGIIGLDLLPGTGVVVRTTAGSAGLYVVIISFGTTTTLKNLNPAGTAAGGLADEYGYLQVNKIAVSGAGSLNGTTGVTLLAGTDKGGYFTTGVPGDPALVWKAATAQSGVTDQSLTFIAASPTQTVLQHSFERMYAASDQQLWVSNSGGFWFYDILQAALDKGPFWTALAKACGAPIPDNTVGAIVSAGSDAGLLDANGTITGNTLLTLPTGSPFGLPANIARCRRLTARNDFTWRMVKVDSAAPYNAIEIQQLAEITADDSRGAITAAEQLDLAAWRFLAEHQANPLTLQLEGMTYRVQEALLPTLLTGDMVSVSATYQQIGPDGTITVVCDWEAANFYVLSYDEVKDGSVMKVSMQVGNILSLLDDAVNLLKEIVSGTSYGLSRDKRYRRIR